MVTRPNFQINAERLWASLMDMAAIGGTPKGGCNRQALTPEDALGRDLFRRWCEAAGAVVRTDPLGSLFARIEGQEDLPPVLIGSHLDTQPTGGKFDGVLGVLAGVEILRCLQENSIRPRRPIEIVNWTNEEGCRFAPAMLASAVYAGLLDLDAARDVTDSAGIRFGDALDAIGIVADIPIAGREIAAYLELHIEQGPILEAADVDIGIVIAGQGLRWYDVTIDGFESHAGSTPMPRRRDALVAAATCIAGIQAIGHRFGPHGVGTVGQLTVSPNSRNVIPGSVTFTVDLRHPDADILARMDAEFRAEVEKLGSSGFHLHIEDVDDSPPTRFDAGLLAMLREEAERLGYSHCDIISGAGHDAFHLAKVAPAAMIFVPCKDGISHNEAEDITLQWARNGANLLMRTALRLAEAD